jgi:hypothetical protein
VRILFSSIENVTSIYGIPFMADGIPESINSPNKWLSLVNGLSPSKILVLTYV